jgi:hypothetical protein
MTWGIRGRALVVSSLFLLFAAGAALADARQEFAQETGLDSNLIGVIQTDVGGTEMTIVFVFVNDRALDSRISPTLRQELLPYVGRNALYVNPGVRSVVDRFGFDPQAIAVQPEGGQRFVPPASAWVEITPGFRTGSFQMNPAGATQGSGSEGILILGDRIDPAKPFTVYYGSEPVTFDLSTGSSSTLGSTGSTSSLSHEPITVPALEDVTSLEDVLALPDLTSDSLAVLFGLDRSLVRLLDVPVKSDTIRMVFVRLEESVRTSSLGPELLERLDAVIGTGAVMVFVWSAVAPSFSPWYFYIQQSGANHVFFSDASFVELTAGFLDLTHLVPGQLAAAVIRLPKSVHPLEPFGVRYSTFGVAYP